MLASQDKVQIHLDKDWFKVSRTFSNFYELFQFTFILLWWQQKAFRHLKTWAAGVREKVVNCCNISCLFSLSTLYESRNTTKNINLAVSILQLSCTHTATSTAPSSHNWITLLFLHSGSYSIWVGELFTFPPSVTHSPLAVTVSHSFVKINKNSLFLLLFLPLHSSLPGICPTEVRQSGFPRSAGLQQVEAGVDVGPDPLRQHLGVLRGYRGQV